MGSPGKKILVVGRGAYEEVIRGGYKEQLEKHNLVIRGGERSDIVADVKKHRPHVLIVEAAEAGDALEAMREAKKEVKFMVVFLAARVEDLDAAAGYWEIDHLDLLLRPLDKNRLFMEKIMGCERERLVHIVDDDAGTVEYYKKFLEMHGYIVSSSHTGLDALLLKKAGRLEAPLMLLDVRMPGMDGVSFLGRLREIDQETVVIMQTGERNTETVASAAAKGIAGYLGKPVSLMDGLLPEVRRAGFKKRLVDLDKALGCGVCSVSPGKDIGAMAAALKAELVKRMG